MTPTTSTRPRPLLLRLQLRPLPLLLRPHMATLIPTLSLATRLKIHTLSRHTLLLSKILTISPLPCFRPTTRKFFLRLLLHTITC